MSTFSFYHEAEVPIQIRLGVEGHYEPAYGLSGPPEDSGPADGEEERTIEDVEIDGKALPDDLAKPLRAWLEKNVVDEIDIPESEYDMGDDGPEYDPNDKQ